MEPIISIIPMTDDMPKISCISTINNGWYMHGKLEEAAGYDIAGCYEISGDCPTIDIEKCGMQFKQLNINGVYPVKVYGIEETCIGYFWVSPINNDTSLQRGLVVFENDAEANEYAKAKYESKAKFL